MVISQRRHSLCDMVGSLTAGDKPFGRVQRKVVFALPNNRPLAVADKTA